MVGTNVVEPGFTLTDQTSSRLSFIHSLRALTSYWGYWLPANAWNHVQLYNQTYVVTDLVRDGREELCCARSSRKDLDRCQVPEAEEAEQLEHHGARTSSTPVSEK